MDKPETARCTLMQFAYKVSELFSRHVEDGTAESLNVVLPAYGEDCSPHRDDEGRHSLRSVEMKMGPLDSSQESRSRRIP
jgi:hypothetical protein